MLTDDSLTGERTIVGLLLIAELPASRLFVGQLNIDHLVLQPEKAEVTLDRHFVRNPLGPSLLDSGCLYRCADPHKHD